MTITVNAVDRDSLDQAIRSPPLPSANDAAESKSFSGNPAAFRQKTRKVYPFGG